MKILVTKQPENRKLCLHQIAQGSVIRANEELFIVGQKFSETAGIYVCNLQTGTVAMWNKFETGFQIEDGIVVSNYSNLKSLWGNIT